MGVHGIKKDFFDALAQKGRRLCKMSSSYSTGSSLAMSYV
jgi:hypothetical protein